MVAHLINAPFNLTYEIISQALKIYKSDWMSVWQFAVPYRDPSSLARKWRIAHGIQKSYKQQNPEKKEKRRIYESTRRKMKAANHVRPYSSGRHFFSVSETIYNNYSYTFIVIVSRSNEFQHS